MILLGILCGLTLNIAYGPINIGEVIFLLYGIFYLIKSKKIRFDNNFKLYIIFSVLFILYTMIYFQIDIIETRNILKNIFKYVILLYFSHLLELSYIFPIVYYIYLLIYILLQVLYNLFYNLLASNFLDYLEKISL